jgi:hypothetical protein
MSGMAKTMSTALPAMTQSFLSNLNSTLSFLGPKAFSQCPPEMYKGVVKVIDLLEQQSQTESMNLGEISAVVCIILFLIFFVKRNFHL